MCAKAHLYTIEVPGQGHRYAGTDFGAAVDALVGALADSGTAGFALAEHHLQSGTTEYDPRDSTEHCPDTTQDVEGYARIITRSRKV